MHTQTVAKMATKKDFCDVICFSTVDYNFLRQRPQQIMSRLSEKGARILYVQPPLRIMSLREVLKRIQHYFKIQKQDGVYVCSLPLVIWTGILLGRSLSKVMLYTFMRRLRMGKNRPLLLWFYDVHYSFLAGRMDESLCIYDCVDELSGFSRVTQRHLEYEKDLLRKADIVFVTSYTLFTRKKGVFCKKSIHIVRNAADFDHFSQCVSRQVRTSKEMQKIKKPIVGFVGMIADWIDFQLIRHIAKTFEVVMIGPVQLVESQISQIRNLPNVHLLGRIEYNELPKYLRAMDICIVPFKQNKLTESANPVKIYEYLAAGKPVVCTALPETKHFGHFVKTVVDRNGFLDAIQEELNKTAKYEEAIERREFAKINSWDSRCEEMLRIINHHLTLKET